VNILSNSQVKKKQNSGRKCSKSCRKDLIERGTVKTTLKDDLESDHARWVH